MTGMLKTNNDLGKNVVQWDVAYDCAECLHLLFGMRAGDLTREHVGIRSISRCG